MNGGCMLIYRIMTEVETLINIANNGGKIMVNVFELPVCCGRQKSFYGKAQVIATAGGFTLRSYATDVAWTDGIHLTRLWDGYSETTMRHVQSFCALYGIPCGGKLWWMGLPVGTGV